MSGIDASFIEKAAELMKSGGLSELTLEEGAQSLYIKAGCSYSEPQAAQLKISEIKNEKQGRKLIPIVSNMIGLFFLKPSPEGRPFVHEGDRVKAGQQLCIIETIKLMNKITSDVSGTVKEICIEDGRPVEYGQTMMYIEQD